MTSVGVATEPNSMFLSSTDIVVEFIVVVVPFTVKSPLNVKLIADIVPVNVGFADNTLLPVPVLVTDTKFLDPSVATALDAVSPDKVVPVEETVPGKLVFPLPSNRVAVRTSDANVPLYCRT